jgi:hypothetical protein
MAARVVTIGAALDKYCDIGVADNSDAYRLIRGIVPVTVGVTDLLRDHMGVYLAHGEGRVRGRATKLLASLLADCGPAFLGHDAVTQKQVACTLLQFLCARLSDSPRCVGRWHHFCESSSPLLARVAPRVLGPPGGAPSSRLS